MPEVRKQTVAVPAPATRKPMPPPAPKPATANGPVIEALGGTKLLLYGRSGTGKTRIAATFPKPQLLIATDYGIKSIATGRAKKADLDYGGDKPLPLYSLFLGDKPRGIDLALVDDLPQFDMLLDWMQTQPYKSYAVDHAGGMQDIILKSFLGLSDIPQQKSWGMTDRQGWGVVGSWFKERFFKLLHYGELTGKDVVIIAHERNTKEEGNTSDVMLPSVGAALTPGIAGWLNGAVDYIGQTYIKQEVEISNNDGVDIAVPTGRKQFCLRTGPHEIFSSKFRVAEGSILPELIVNPTFDKIVAVINGKEVK